jgi:peptidoglycan hydrolase-like protein with peptidoglycan-binding domain
VWLNSIQRTLYRGGDNPGPTNGTVGRQTMAAVNAFQKDFNLTVADYLTIETVRALGANF